MLGWEVFVLCYSATVVVLRSPPVAVTTAAKKLEQKRGEQTILAS